MDLLIRITAATYCAKAVPGGLVTSSPLFSISTGCRGGVSSHSRVGKQRLRDGKLLARTARSYQAGVWTQVGLVPRHVLLSLSLLEMLPARELRERPKSTNWWAVFLSHPPQFFLLAISYSLLKAHFKSCPFWTSLVVQWLSIHLPMQMWVWSLTQEDPTCCGATQPVCCNFWACALGSRSPNHWSPHMPEPVPCNKRSHSKWEARELQLESSPCSPQLFHMLEFVWDWGSTHSNEETAQPKINKYIKLKKGKKDYPSQYREHGFDPWSGKIPHAAKQVSLRSKSAWEPQTSGLEPGLCNKRNHCNEKTAHRNRA